MVNLRLGRSAFASELIHNLLQDASDTMDVQKCSRFCGKYQYAGLEYGREVSRTPLTDS